MPWGAVRLSGLSQWHLVLSVISVFQGLVFGSVANRKRTTMDNAQRVAGRRRKFFTWTALIVILIGATVGFGWYKFFREEPQPDWVFANADMRFKYGSIGAQFDAGVPY